MAEYTWFYLEVHAMGEIAYRLLIEFNHKVTSLLRVWILNKATSDSKLIDSPACILVLLQCHDLHNLQMIDWLTDWCSQAVLENSQNTSYNIRVHRTDSVLWHDYMTRRKEKTTTDSAASTHICSSCGKDCHSRIGLISHRRHCLERSTTIWQW